MGGERTCRAPTPGAGRPTIDQLLATMEAMVAASYFTRASAVGYRV